MARRSDAKILRMGAISLVLLLLVMAASFNLQKFPGFRGTTYHAELTDASGLRTGSEVQVAGIRVGRVNDLRIGPEQVIADFDVKDATLGRSTRASVEVKSLLGEKFLNIKPEGSGSLPGGATIPLARTDVTFDIVGTLGKLTTQTEETDKENLTKALNTLAETIDAAAPEVKSSFTGPVPPLDDDRDARRGDRAAAAPFAQRHGAARRAQGRSRAADGAGRPGLPGAAAAQGDDPHAPGQRQPAGRPARGRGQGQPRAAPPHAGQAGERADASCTRARTRSRRSSTTTAPTSTSSATSSAPVRGSTRTSPTSSVCSPVSSAPGPVVPMTSWSRRTQLLAAAIPVALLLLAFLVFPGDGSRTVTAHFDRAVAVYPGTDLRVMGVQIGEVTAVVPDGNSVRVEMVYDEEYKLPADAKAAVVTPTLVADRYVQVFPAYGKGAVMPDDADIPLARTQTPIELDRMFKALDDLSVTLGPKAGSTDGALDNLLTAGRRRSTATASSAPRRSATCRRPRRRSPATAVRSSTTSARSRRSPTPWRRTTPPCRTSSRTSPRCPDSSRASARSSARCWPRWRGCSARQGFRARESRDARQGRRAADQPARAGGQPEGRPRPGGPEGLAGDEQPRHGLRVRHRHLRLPGSGGARATGTSVWTSSCAAAVNRHFCRRSARCSAPLLELLTARALGQRGQCGGPGTDDRPDRTGCTIDARPVEGARPCCHCSGVMSDDASRPRGGPGGPGSPDERLHASTASTTCPCPATR